ncbi:DUF2834 domain-containing protein [Zhongshania aliphaticivorans]|uniref:DUF2834 domain-containing protein n=1 Tax=Zhongshania aliphaticivorans TaxID=1470434 RepID=UPI0012E49CBC|nr:DUF2834 domain-containing protein [Zhongshania aliphaticivorans]CAA0120558.1 Uncharacterised protein [Zhongshania aliphaticivorans]
MELKAKPLVIVYLISALLALIMTWIHVPAYLGDGFVNANIKFWNDALFNANPAGKFLTIDILFLAFVCNVWMFIEGRRLGVKYIYLYVIGGVVIAISVAFPLFMAARELKLAAKESSAVSYKIKSVDLVALLCLFLTAVLASYAVL